MALIEKHLADELIELRAIEGTGSRYVPIEDMIAALQRHLDREMALRATIADMGREVERLEIAGADR